MGGSSTALRRCRGGARIWRYASAAVSVAGCVDRVPRRAAARASRTAKFRSLSAPTPVWRGEGFARPPQDLPTPPSLAGAHRTHPRPSTAGRARHGSRPGRRYRLLRRVRRPRRQGGASAARAWFDRIRRGRKALFFSAREVLFSRRSRARPVARANRLIANRVADRSLLSRTRSTALAAADNDDDVSVTLVSPRSDRDPTA